MIERKGPRSNTIETPGEARFAKFIFAQNWEIAEAMVLFHGESSNDRARAANGKRAYLRRIRSP